ncbi:beta subunit of citrate lyase [Astrocystis sublimbata]|nr:beta subunit of citrate lyase [Astrocystis sublimbata]
MPSNPTTASPRVPATSPRMLTKSLGLTVDNVTYDLEDSVAPDLKTEARGALKAHLSALTQRPHTIGEVAVRINSISSRHAFDDLLMLSNLPVVDTIVVPKVEGRKDLKTVVHALNNNNEDGRTNHQILALIESARAVMDLSEICSATRRLSGLIFAAEDFALDLSLTRSPSLSEFLYARSAIVTAARANRLQSTIDLVCTQYKDEPGLARLEEECRGGKALGFNGKQCIHPSQVEMVQRLFAPSEDELEWAVRIVITNEKAEGAGKGAYTLDGAMIDAPVVGKSRAIVAKARQCGMNVDDLLTKWKDQEPS